MIGFFKFIGTLTAIFAGMVAALAVFDRIKNKNRIKGEYLECETPEENEEE